MIEKNYDEKARAHRLKTDENYKQGYLDGLAEYHSTVKYWIKQGADIETLQDALFRWFTDEVKEHWKQ